MNNYPNMSYCRYSNTNQSLNQIINLMDDEEELSSMEKMAKSNLVVGCIGFLENMGYVIKSIDDIGEEE